MKGHKINEYFWSNNISGIITDYIYIYMVKKNWNQDVFLELGMKYKDSEQLSS
jgi:hypothetical protein